MNHNLYCALHAHRTLELIEPLHCRKWDRELLEEYKKADASMGRMKNDMLEEELEAGTPATDTDWMILENESSEKAV